MPDRTDTTRARLLPPSPAGWPIPRCRSVMSLRSNSGTLPRAASTIRTASSSGRMSFNDPFTARPIGERAVETMTASVMVFLFLGTGGGRRWSEAQVAADEFLHDLVGTGPDLGHAGVAPGAGDAVLVHETVATMHLHAV